MLVASCCLLALGAAAHADGGAPSKDAGVAHGTVKSKAKKRIKPKSSAPVHGAKAGAHKARVATAAVPRSSTKPRTVRQSGVASWYGAAREGKRTASGEIFDKDELTAAHRTLPLESKVRVTNTANGRSVTVRVTDRGPSSKGRIIDLSQSAAEELGMKQTGVARVNLEALPAHTKPNP